MGFVVLAIGMLDKFEPTFAFFVDFGFFFLKTLRGPLLFLVKFLRISSFSCLQQKFINV